MTEQKLRIKHIAFNTYLMKTKTAIFSSVLAAVLLMSATIHSYSTIKYTISFTATGSTLSVGSVEVKNLTKDTTAIIESGNTLTLLVQPTAVEALKAGNGGIRISQNGNTKTSTITFYANQGGNAQVAAYTIDGRKAAGLSTSFEAGDNSLELALPTGMYVIQVSGTGYTYTARLHSQTNAVTQAAITFLTHTYVESSTAQRSIAEVPSTTTMTYTEGDQLLYTATSDKYISSVPDVPTGNKTINFKFSTLPTSSIPAGTFIMGSPLTEIKRRIIETQHEVTLDAFRMSKYEISNAQYAAFLNAKSIDSTGIWATAAAYPTKTLIYASSDNYDWGLHYNGTQWVPVTGYENAPVINVTWYGASEFAAYVGGTLPTEAQWEYACRAGTTTPFNTGLCLTNMQANYHWAMPYTTSCPNTETTRPGKTQTVGTYAANAYGLFDMHGNVWEWCSDYWDITYPTTKQTNPSGPTTGTSHVIRGGGWFNFAEDCRSAYRFNDYASNKSPYVGFRVVLVP